MAFLYAVTSATFYVFDERGNVVERLDSGGNAITYHRYSAYGREWTTRTPSQVLQDNDPWGFGAQYGYYTDRETGLIYCTFRYYDPNVGRWLNRDPAGYGGGLNLYKYCSNNPVMRIDPRGTYGIPLFTLSAILDAGNARDADDAINLATLHTSLDFMIGYVGTVAMSSVEGGGYEHGGEEEVPLLNRIGNWFQRIGRRNKLPCNIRSTIPEVSIQDVRELKPRMMHTDFKYDSFIGTTNQHYGVEHMGTYYVQGGHTQFQAGVEIWIETGNSYPLDSLLKTGIWDKGVKEAPHYSFPFPIKTK